MAPLRLLVLIALCLTLSKAVWPKDGESDSLMACDMRSELVAYLDQKYGEHQIDWALIDRNSIKELFASPTTGTWSLLRTYTSGASCVVRAGYVGPWSDL